MEDRKAVTQYKTMMTMNYSLSVKRYGTDLKCSGKLEKGKICGIIRATARPCKVNRFEKLVREKRKES